MLVARGLAYARAGRTRDARTMLRQLQALATRDYVAPVFLGILQMGVGDLDNAFESLNRMCDERSIGVIGLKLEPVYDPLRSDPRFGLLLERAGWGL